MIALPDTELFLLVMTRVLAALMVMPVLGHRSIPAVGKIVLAAFMSWLVVMPGSIPTPQPAPGLGAFMAAIVSEILLGLFLGFGSALAFWAIVMAGDLVATQTHSGMGAGFQLSMESSSGSLSQFYSITATLVFLSIGGHRQILLALANTFVTAPPYSIVSGGLQTERLVQIMSTAFAGAFQMALPITGTVLLTDVMMAFLSRIMPQLNAYVFSMPLKVGAGLLALWLSLPVLLVFMARWLSKAALNMQLLMR